MLGPDLLFAGLGMFVALSLFAIFRDPYYLIIVIAFLGSTLIIIGWVISWI